MALERPRLSLRVGITGHRRLDVSEGLRARVREGLQMVQAAAAQLLRDSRRSDAENPPLFQAISPLAEGADRLFATEAIALGFKLECPLPFSQAEYERDFPAAESVKEFRDLLSQAEGRVLELDGPTQDAERSAAYESVGRAVLGQCDLLMAIWDGEQAKGVGGTGQIVELARSAGMPILWINPQTGAALLKTKEGDVPLREEALQRQLQRMFQPMESVVLDSTLKE